jgi:hypothetical protein
MPQSAFVTPAPTSTVVVPKSQGEQSLHAGQVRAPGGQGSQHIGQRMFHQTSFDKLLPYDNRDMPCY